MTDSVCGLLRTQGKEADSSVAEVAARESAKHSPILAWAEPHPLYVNMGNATGRRKNFAPLVDHAPNWPADIPLLEARLFWSDSALHIVAVDEGGARWARIEETDATEETPALARSEFPILSLRDLNRFGLASRWPAPEKMGAVEYREQGRLVAWRLTVSKEEPPDA